MNFLGPEIIILVWFLSIFALVIWSVIDIARNDFVNKDNKVIWLLICLLLGGIGPIIYLTQRKKLLAKFVEGGEFDRLDLDSGRPLREERGRGLDDDYV